jgi:hypothetical protein
MMLLCVSKRGDPLFAKDTRRIQGLGLVKEMIGSKRSVSKKCFGFTSKNRPPKRVNPG